jgi:hypothetical protein
MTETEISCGFSRFRNVWFQPELAYLWETNIKYVYLSTLALLAQFRYECSWYLFVKLKLGNHGHPYVQTSEEYAGHGQEMEIPVAFNRVE